MSKRIKGLEKIYDLREIALKQIFNSYKPLYARGVNKKYITKTYNINWDLYNSLTNVIRYLESIY